MNNSGKILILLFIGLICTGFNCSREKFITRIIVENENHQTITRLQEYTNYLMKDVKDSVLHVFCNGEMIYKIKDNHAKISVRWKYKAPDRTGDTHSSIMRGTKANLVIKQGAEQKYKATLYIEPVDQDNIPDFEKVLNDNFSKGASKYPGLELNKNEDSWEIIIPDKYKIGHEAHFAQVTQKYLKYLVDGKLPEWEVPNIIAKYYTTTLALEMALENK